MRSWICTLGILFALLMASNTMLDITSEREITLSEKTERSFRIYAGSGEKGTRAQPWLNFTYLVADAVGFGSTAFRVNDGDLDIFIEAFPGTGTTWDPATVTKADIIIQSPHGHVSHYDADTVAMVQKNTGAFVVGNTQLKNDMLSRAVNASKIVEIAPTLGQNETSQVLGVNVTAFRMTHTATGDQIDSFIVEMPSGITLYHGTCTSASSFDNYMKGHDEFYGLNVMILDYEHDFAKSNTEFFPDVLMKVHDYQTGRATVWGSYPGGSQQLNHNDTYEYVLPVYEPELSTPDLDPTAGDTETNFTYKVNYRFVPDMPPTTSQVVIDGNAYVMDAESASGWKTGVDFSHITNLSAGTHEYHFNFSVDGKYVRLPETGELQGPQVNAIPALSSGDFSPAAGDTETTFSFNVTYMDGDNDPPTQKKIYIDGEPFSMSSADSTYTDGAIFTYMTYLEEGSHKYYFVFNDGRREARFPLAGELDGPDVDLANHAPELDDWGVTPGTGTRQDRYTYSVEYEDGENDAPTIARVFIDGAGFDMETTDADYDNGAEFTFATNLSLGHHEYHFEFSDGEFDMRIPLEPGEELYGPVVINIPPEAKIDSPDDGEEFTTDDLVTLDASSSYDGDDDELAFQWTSDIDGLLGTGMILATNLSEGMHEITLTVRDEFDGNSTDDTYVNVIRLRPNLEATITTQPVTPVEGQKVSVVAAVRNTGDAPALEVEVSILLDDVVLRSEMIPQLLVGENHLVKCEFNATISGKRVITVSFADGENFTLKLTVKVRDGPLAVAGNNVRIDLGGSITFDGSESSSAGSIVSYLWDFGDGTNATGKRVTHDFTKAGTFTVTLTVVDDLGKEHEDTLRVTVNPAKKEGGREGKSVVTFVIIGVVVVVIGVVLALLLVLRGRKKGTMDDAEGTGDVEGTGEEEGRIEPPGSEPSPEQDGSVVPGSEGTEGEQAVKTPQNDAQAWFEQDEEW